MNISANYEVFRYWCYYAALMADILRNYADIPTDRSARTHTRTPGVVVDDTWWCALTSNYWIGANVQTVTI